MESMESSAFFENSGTKIKKLAHILWIVSIFLASLVVFLFLIIATHLGFGVFLGGLLISLILIASGYVSSLLIYGFGELITNTANIKKSFGAPESTTSDTDQ